jgi:hypothetical protein
MKNANAGLVVWSHHNPFWQPTVPRLPTALQSDFEPSEPMEIE